MTLHKQYLATFDGEAGKAVLNDIYRAGMLMLPTFNSDPMKAAHNEGKRALALYILSKLDTQAAEKHLAEQGDKPNGR